MKPFSVWLILFASFLSGGCAGMVAADPCWLLENHFRLRDIRSASLSCATLFAKHKTQGPHSTGWMTGTGGGILRASAAALRASANAFKRATSAAVACASKAAINSATLGDGGRGEILFSASRTSLTVIGNKSPLRTALMRSSESIHPLSQSVQHGPVQQASDPLLRRLTPRFSDEKCHQTNCENPTARYGVEIAAPSDQSAKDQHADHVNHPPIKAQQHGPAQQASRTRFRTECEVEHGPNKKGVSA